MGGGKALVSLLGAPMAAHVAAVLRPVVAALAVVGDDRAAEAIDAVALTDGAGEVAGPLRGIIAGLEWARTQGAEWLVVAPCVAPLLPQDLVDRLMEGVEATSVRPRYASTPSGLQPLVSAWPTSLAPALRGDLAKEHPPGHARLERYPASPVRVGAEPAIFNVNSPLDLAEAEELMRTSGRAHPRPPRR
jgi:molybdopterin-guanine dinucleotide biosynthesis protein A